MELHIDNRKMMEISDREQGHAYTNETQVIWNGVLGEMTLSVVPETEIERVEVYPDVKKRQIAIHTYQQGTIREELAYSLDGKRVDVLSSEQKDGKTIATIQLPDNVGEWNEFHPELHTIEVAGTTALAKSATFGLREMSNTEGKLCVNGKPVFLRGTLECCIFPLTGNPPTDEAGWEKVMGTAKEWGLNHLRFHSWCPPDAAFRVADRLGLYLSVELPVWSLRIGDDPAVFRFMEEEYERIVRHYGNHPSLCMLSCGNELMYDFQFLNGLVAKMKQRDRRHLYITTSFTFEPGHGGKNEPEDEYYVTQWTDNGWVRGQGVFDEQPPSFNKNYDASMGCLTVPLISHEIGQYAVYPDMKEIDKYTGSLLPLNLMGIRDDLEKKGLLDKAEDWLHASGRLAAILYKEECERAMKTQGFSGYQLLGLQDFPGQSTALVGLVNSFWDSKHVVEAEWFRQFCAPVVPLANFEKAVWRNDETFTGMIQVANYTEESLKGKTVSWHMSDTNGNIISEGTIPTEEIPSGNVSAIGSISVPLSNISQAGQFTIGLTIDDTSYHNEWNIWVYPPVTLPQGIHATHDTKEAIALLEQGEKVLLSPRLGSIEGLEGKFLPVFWSPVHFPKQAGTMGVLCNPEHPALSKFPTEKWSNWQWWRLAKRATVIVTDSLSGITPLVEEVDNFANNRQLALVFEAKCGKGSLLFSSIDLLSEGAESPEVRQLLYSLECYMLSPSFSPQGDLSPDALSSLIKEKPDISQSSPTDIY